MTKRPIPGGPSAGTAPVAPPFVADIREEPDLGDMLLPLGILPSRLAEAGTPYCLLEADFDGRLALLAACPDRQAAENLRDLLENAWSG